MRRVTHRRFAIGFYFAIWIAAAGLACGIFNPPQLPPAQEQSRSFDPTSVVHVQPEKTADIAAKTTLAER